MKLSCLPISFFEPILTGKMRIGEWATMARDCGLDAIDLSVVLIRNHSSRTLNEIRGEMESAAMPLTMITTYPDFTHPSELQRRRELEYVRNDIALASQLGARYLRITAGQAHPETGRHEGVAWAVESFKRSAEVADSYGVVLLFENHSKPGVWEHADFSMPIDIFLEIYAKTRDTTIKVNFDTGNPYVVGADPISLLSEVIADVRTLHIADNARSGALSPVVIGTGIVSFEPIFALLKKHNFDGWFCIEEASGTEQDGIQTAVDFVRHGWEDGFRRKK